MWRRQADRQETVPLRPGTCVSIPAGTHFQFRSAADGPLAAVGVTMPPWPGDDEAYDVPGAWPPTGADEMTHEPIEPIARFVGAPGYAAQPALPDYLDLLGGRGQWRSAAGDRVRMPRVVRRPHEPDAVTVPRPDLHRPPGPGSRPGARGPRRSGGGGRRPRPARRNNTRTRVLLGPTPPPYPSRRSPRRPPHDLSVRDISKAPCPDACLRRRIAFAAKRRWACNQGKSLFGGR